MKCLRSVVLLVLVFPFVKLTAQADYISLGSRQYSVLDRMEIKLRTDPVLNYSSVKPFDRRLVMERLENINAMAARREVTLSKVDKYNLDLLMKDNFEWRSGFGDSSLKVKDIFSSVGKGHPIYIGVKRGDFSVFVAPIFNLSLGKDNNLGGTLFTNQRGLYFRGTLTKGLGYYSYFTTNQERDPLYVQQYGTKFSAVPNAGYFKSFKNDGYDYFDARGGIMFKAAKGIDVQFAYDKVFIGNGYRSLILSDFSNDMLFLKINARIWKFNYYNLFAELTAPYKLTGDYLRPKKYMSFHYLDFRVSKTLNIGLFEDVMFGRNNGFELNYLNPLILYRAIEQQLGSPDKVTLGLNVKLNAFKNTQLYSQLIINEFLIKEVLKYKDGYWANKQALQLGLKRIDLFNIKNLDLQLEANLIRPFVYTHYDSSGSFTHYNQPLAHPLGANLREFIGVLRYQPFNKLQLEAKVMYNEQGLDSAGRNFGSNIFELYTTRTRDYGFHIGSGILAKSTTASFTASYELIPDMFLDVNALIRRYSTAGSTFNSNIFNVSIRMNLQRRQFDF